MTEAKNHRQRKISGGWADAKLAYHQKPLIQDAMKHLRIRIYDFLHGGKLRREAGEK